jgi:hypothetical protein
MLHVVKVNSRILMCIIKMWLSSLVTITWNPLTFFNALSLSAPLMSRSIRSAACNWSRLALSLSCHHRITKNIDERLGIHLGVIVSVPPPPIDVEASVFMLQPVTRSNRRLLISVQNRCGYWMTSSIIIRQYAMSRAAIGDSLTLSLFSIPI